jgi:hypothetical protein
MRRRLPTPALVIACIALFVALGGAGFAASVAMVKAPQLTTLVSGSMSANGKLIGGLSHGTERSAGVYTLTITGGTFAFNNKSFPQPRLSVTPTLTIVGKAGAATPPPSCAVASEAIASNGRATAEVDCFTYDAAAGGWVPTSTGFDFQMLGPSR